MTRPVPLHVPIRRLPHAEGLPLPAYATPDAAGLDLLAAIAEPVTLKPGERRLVPTGISIAVPAGFEAQVRPRSGLALKHGISVLNAPGTVDADYRGEVGVILINHGDQPFVIQRGERIAQLIVDAYSRVEWIAVAELPQTQRGEGGFGSTGVAAPAKTAAGE